MVTPQCYKLSLRWYDVGRCYPPYAPFLWGQRGIGALIATA